MIAVWRCVYQRDLLCDGLQSSLGLTLKVERATKLVAAAAAAAAHHVVSRTAAAAAAAAV